jgi:hypothetical protein
LRNHTGGRAATEGEFHGLLTDINRLLLKIFTLDKRSFYIQTRLFTHKQNRRHDSGPAEQLLETAMRDVKLSPADTRDSGKVRLGNMSPSLPAARPASAETADNGKVRMGNMSPSFPAAKSNAATADSGKVRLGNMSPSLPAARPTSAATADNGKVRLGNMRPAI